MIVVRSRSYIRSRNTLIIFSLLFFTFVISFKFIIGFAVDNLIILTGTIVESGNIDFSKFQIDWDFIDFSKLGSHLWKFEELKGSLNHSLHELVDIIAPALINTISVLSAQVMTARVILLNHPNMIAPMMLYDYPYVMFI